MEHETKPQNATGKPLATSLEKRVPGGDGFDLVECEGDLWREMMLAWSGMQIAIRLLPEEKPFRNSLHYAKRLADDRAAFSQSLQMFLEEAKETFPID